MLISKLRKTSELIKALQKKLSANSNSIAQVSANVDSKQDQHPYLDDISAITSPTTNDVITWDGSNWIAAASSGSGDMTKAVYDTNNNGIVDNSEKLNGQSASYYTNSDNITEGSTNLYFTSARVLASVLTGLSASSGTFTSTDTILTAFNKCKYLIDNLSTLVLATTLTGLSSSSGTYTSSDTLLTALGKLKYLLDNFGASVNAEIAIFSDYTDGTAVTASGTNTISKSVLVAANKIAVGDICTMWAWFEKNGVSAANDRIYVNTSNSLTGATLIATLNPGASDKYDTIQRRFVVKSSTSTKFFAVGSSSASDITTSTQATASVNIDWTQNQYIIFACQNNVGGDSNLCTNANLTRTR
jgi:hypothetical protein